MNGPPGSPVAETLVEGEITSWAVLDGYTLSVAVRVVLPCPLVVLVNVMETVYVPAASEFAAE